MKTNMTPAGTLKEKCKHPRESNFLHVVSQIVNCETTVVRCGVCLENLSDPETDCR